MIAQHDKPWPCKILWSDDGRPVPSLPEDGASLPPQNGVRLIVWPTEAEAAAYVTGLNEARQIPVGRGHGLLAAVVAVATPGDESRLDDRGGLEDLRRRLAWHWLTPVVGHPGIAGSIDIDLAAQPMPLLCVGGRLFTIEQDEHDVLIQGRHAVPTHVLRDAIRRQPGTSWADVALTKDEATLRTGRAEILRSPDILIDFARAFAEAETQASEEVLCAWIRKDPAHRKITDLMQDGWRLLRFDGTGHLVPPDDLNRGGRTLGTVMIARLLRAGLIRRPLYLETLYRRDPYRSGISDGTYAYELGPHASRNDPSVPPLRNIKS